MQIGKNYKIESDSLNVTLLKGTTSKKTGKESYKPVGYFPKVGNALKFMVDLEIKETGLINFKTVCQKQDELYKLIESLKISNQGVTR